MANVLSLPHFDSRFKRLAKKLTAELAQLTISVEKDPKQGVSLGNGLYKIRFGSESKGGGKSGGFRIITCYIGKFETKNKIYLVTIYDKSEESNIKKEVLIKVINSTFDRE